MGQYDTSDLRRRQHSGDVGHAVLGSPSRTSSKQRRRAFRLPVALLVLGFLLSLWGPLPGLGMFLILGAVMGLVITAGLMLNDGLS
jgi:hypothetical protein